MFLNDLSPPYTVEPASVGTVAKVAMVFDSALAGCGGLLFIAKKKRKQRGMSKEVALGEK